MLYDCRNLITKFIIFIFTVVKSAICVVFVLDISLKNWCISSINLNLCWLRDKYKCRRWQSRFTVVCTENNTIALAGMSQWIEHQPVNQEVTGLIPSQGTSHSCGPGPHLGHARGNWSMCLLQIAVSSPFLSPSFLLSLKKLNK